MLKKYPTCYGILTTQPLVYAVSLRKILMTMKTHNHFINLISGWQWYSDTFMLRLFLHLLVCAGSDTLRWRGMVLPAGSLITSITALRSETGMSRARIRSCLNRLQDSDEISYVRKGRYTIITVKNYGVFHLADNQSDTGIKDSVAATERSFESDMYRHSHSEPVNSVTGVRRAVDKSDINALTSGYWHTYRTDNRLRCKSFGISSRRLRGLIHRIVTEWCLDRQTVGNSSELYSYLNTELNTVLLRSGFRCVDSPSDVEQYGYGDHCKQHQPGRESKQRVERASRGGTQACAGGKMQSQIQPGYDYGSHRMHTPHRII